MAVQINTAAVATAADQIDTYNKNIRDGLSKVDSAIKTLQQSWEGKASESSINKYNYIKRNFSDTRFSVVNGLVTIMKVQAGEGYEITEQSVSKAASAFK